MKDLRVASVQFCPRQGDKDHNLNIIEDWVEKASNSRVELIAFPEMCITGYWWVRKLGKEEIDALSEEVPSGPSTGKLRTLSKKYRMSIGAGLIERSSEGAPSGTARSTALSANIWNQATALLYSIPRTGAESAYSSAMTTISSRM